MANTQTNASADKTAEVTDNKALLEAKDATIAELKEEVAKKEAAIEDAVNEQVSKTESEISDLKDQVANKDEALKAKDVTIAGLEKQLKEANAKPTESDKPVYKGYQFLVDSFRFKGNKHKSVEAVKDESLMKALIEAKFSGLKKVK
ncbi:hypothetical protein [Tenacibaculum sp. 47A_GOM-205m]|uniref:hypothetical protein n=1 Tax=Tenacibaculum sp. 47A_GOM-205m TaxID=1380384 RepID=UPI00048B305C|nr:hypothetical protein [Tenacibaculum sp. 47A_GOM-205m]